MTQHAVNPNGGELPIVSEQVSNCPVCAGKMETVYNRGHQHVSVCVDCRADLTVPTAAWDVLRRKRQLSSTPE
jgi:hypothetical protein